MWTALRTNWPAYVGEAAGLAFFMCNAAWLTTLLEYTASPVRRLFDPLGDGPAAGLCRRLPLGVGMAVVVAIIVYNPLGKRSGAHINPAVTAAFWRLGKISAADAAWYVLSQFAGAVAAGFAMAAVLGNPFRDPHVKMAATMPGPAGAAAAFAAEFAMTFVLVWVILACLTRRRWEMRTGWAVAGLLMAYLWFETPLSGMSLNPARTFGSAVAAGRYSGVWIYFTAPVLAAVAAAESFARLGNMGELRSHGLIPADRAAGVTVGDQLIPQYPAAAS